MQQEEHRLHAGDLPRAPAVEGLVESHGSQKHVRHVGDLPRSIQSDGANPPFWGITPRSSTFT